LRHKINREASDHYGIMYNRPNTPAPKQENKYSEPNLVEDEDEESLRMIFFFGYLASLFSTRFGNAFAEPLAVIISLIALGDKRVAPNLNLLIIYIRIKKNIELLEQILYFLEINQSLYPALFVNHFWYHCGAPILWRRIEFFTEKDYQRGQHGRKMPRVLTRRLINFKRVMCEKIKPLYCSKMVYLRLEGLKIKDALISAILRSCPDIRILILDRSDGFSNIPIIEIARYCPKLLHLSLNSCICLTNRCITEIARSCPKLRHLELGNCSIGNKAVEEIARNCTNLKYLGLKGCKGISEEVMKKLNPKIKIEHPDYSDDEWSDLPSLIPDETDFISAFGDYIQVSSGLTRPERINILNSLVQAIDQRLH
ncbi:9210_t:CDS:2, partial [Entrophospora sp. SA101]